ncbi:MAG: hydroxymethylglutaryl-CoA lyase [Myxococcota bacterium]
MQGISPGSISIFEVSPRDGLQNEPVVLSPEQRIAYINRLTQIGFRDVEIGSFVSPRWIPQMANTAEVYARIEKRPGVRYWTLVPNPRGLEAALQAGLQHIAVFMSTSETHNRKNINRSIGESLREQREVISTALAHGVQVRSYLSTVFGCPYEGAVDPEQVVDLAAALSEAGASMISLGDTIGVGHPNQVSDVVARVSQVVPLDQLALHFHDTCGMALVNVWAGLEAGVTTFDASLSGIGGCPYAPGAAGNLATEDLLHFLQGQGLRTPVSLDDAAQGGLFLRELLGRPLPGRYHNYFAGTCLRKARVAQNQQAQQEQ